MPEFFGPNTVLWYYSEEPVSGLMFCAVALLAVLVDVAIREIVLNKNRGVAS